MGTISVVLLGTAGCSNRERNVIVRASPFVSRHYDQFDEGGSDHVINAARAFATVHGMDFLLSRDEPAPGDFNVTAAGKGLNLKAVHVKSAKGGLDVFAIADHSPDDSDKRLFAEFRCQVASDCSED